MLTLRQAKDRTLRRLSIAAGADVSIYSEEPLQEIIQHKIDSLFDAEWWPQFYDPGIVVPIDGEGLPTVDLSPYIKRYMDIRYVFPGSSDLPLPRISHRVNLGNVKRLGITNNPDPQKPFRILGDKTNITSVVVSYRTQPEPLASDDDLINFDDQLIILGSAYDYISDLGINPSQEDKLLTLFNSRYKALTDSMFGTTEVNLSSTSNPAYPNTWRDEEYDFG